MYRYGQGLWICGRCVCYFLLLNFFCFQIFSTEKEAVDMVNTLLQYTPGKRAGGLETVGGKFFKELRGSTKKTIPLLDFMPNTYNIAEATTGN